MASILIIDDDSKLLESLSSLLKEHGYAVQTSNHSEQARKAFAEQRPDLIILEVRIDHNAGWNLLGDIASERPVVVLSGASLEEDVVRAFEQGAIEHIAKPYRSEELLARIRVRLETAPLAPIAVASNAPISAPTPQSSAPTPQPATPHKPLLRRPDPDEEAVFMSDAEEMALLRSQPPEPIKRPVQTDGEPKTLGRQLHAERLRRQLTLVQIENDIKIRMSYLQAIEDEKFTLLPRGPVAIQMVRQYADYLSLDSADIAEDFRKNHYVEPTEPPPALGGRRLPRSLPRWAVLLIAIVLALVLAIGAIYLLDPTFVSQVPEYIGQLWIWMQSLVQ